MITTAHCKECGSEVGVKGILDYNAQEIDRQYREAEGIITVKEIENLGYIYKLGKALQMRYILSHLLLSVFL